VPPRKNPPSSSRRAAGFQSINLSIYLSNKRGRGGGREALAGGAGAGHVGGEVEGMMAGWDEREARRGEERRRHGTSWVSGLLCLRLWPPLAACGPAGCCGVGALVRRGWTSWPAPNIDVFKKYSINIDIYRCMSIYFYKYMYIYPISMNISERLSRFDFEIHEVGHQERLTVDRDVTPTERIISRKYNTHIKSNI
jgi:hypothetical protein